MSTKKFVLVTSILLCLFFTLIISTLFLYSHYFSKPALTDFQLTTIQPTDEYVYFTRDETTQNNTFTRVGQDGNDTSVLHEWNSNGFSIDNFALSPLHTKVAWTESFIDAHFLNLETKQTTKISFGTYKEYGFINSIFWINDTQIIIEATDPTSKDGFHYFFTYVLGNENSITKVGCDQRPTGNYINSYFHQQNNMLYFVGEDTTKVYSCDVSSGETKLVYQSPYEGISQLTVAEPYLIFELQYRIPDVEYHVGSNFKYTVFDTGTERAELININDYYTLNITTPQSLLFNDGLGECVYDYSITDKTLVKAYCNYDLTNAATSYLTRSDYEYHWKQNATDNSKGDLIRVNAITELSSTVKNHIPYLYWGTYIN